MISKVTRTIKSSKCRLKNKKKNLPSPCWFLTAPWKVNWTISEMCTGKNISCVLYQKKWRDKKADFPLHSCPFFWVKIIEGVRLNLIQEKSRAPSICWQNSILVYYLEHTEQAATSSGLPSRHMHPKWVKATAFLHSQDVGKLFSILLMKNPSFPHSHGNSPYVTQFRKYNIYPLLINCLLWLCF